MLSVLIWWHRTHETRSIAADVSVAWCLSISLPVTRLYLAKTSVLFGLETFEGLRNSALNGGPDLPTERRKGGFDAAFTKVLWPLVENSFIPLLDPLL